jgi:hypothetical protein
MRETVSPHQLPYRRNPKLKARWVKVTRMFRQFDEPRSEANSMAVPHLPFALRVFDSDPTRIGFVLLNILSAKAARAELDDHAQVLSNSPP